MDSPLPTPPSSTTSGEGSTSPYALYAVVYGLGSLYLVPSVISWRRLWRNRSSDPTAVRLFGMIAIGTLVRFAGFASVCCWMIHAARSTKSMLSYHQLVVSWELLNILGSLVLVGVFLLVLATWAGMIERVVTSIGFGMHHQHLHDASSSSASSPRSYRCFFFKVNATSYVLKVAGFGLFDAFPNTIWSMSVYFVTACCVAVVSFVCIFLVPVYGRKMCQLLDKLEENATRRKRNIRRITVISTIFFLLRTLEELLLALSLYATVAHAFDDGGGTTTSSSGASGSSFGTNTTLTSPSWLTSFGSAPSTSLWSQPSDDPDSENPMLFLQAQSADPVISWSVLLEIVSFPMEWTLLMALLCVLPSRAVLPSMRGYNPIPDFNASM